MESDGRIRSKDIGTGEVNSRALDNIRSSNFNGSHVDPENDPGTLGWQILKSGVVVFNNAVIRGTLKAVKILAGTLNIGTGGTITLGDESAPTATLSETGIEVGPTSLTASGVQVGTDVVMDSDGLKIAGVLQPAIEPFTDKDQVINVSLTTTVQDVLTITVTPPAWAQKMQLLTILEARISGSASHRLDTYFRIDTNPDISLLSQNVVSGETASLTNATTIIETETGVSLPSSFTVRGRAVLSSGTNSNNKFELHVQALFLRA